ncbi:ethanolamine ammonia-lyase subunit EutB [Leeuwenhoekiella sp. A16]|uniref:ethanolamine ammonia-lyase subunit EutB n=1 Tax=unclassified Leeuwenhoekiella TaxID=2615029 RepID=UPI003A801097
MQEITRKEFIIKFGLMSTSIMMINGCNFASPEENQLSGKGVVIPGIENEEDIFKYIHRTAGKMDFTLYRKIIGSANAFKEGDLTLGIAAADEKSRKNAQNLLSRTKIADLNKYPVFQDELYELIVNSTSNNENVHSWTLGQLKSYLLEKPEAEIKLIMPALSSDIIACVVKLMSNDELIQIGQKVFNPLPNSKIGSKGYLSARVQPNSPTDNIDDIIWQVFDAWSYAVGDLVLGTNPVSSEPQSVAKIEQALFDIITTFGLEKTIPNCVLSHIDIQAKAEEIQPGTTGIWFQSLAGTVNANKTFDVSIEKMQHYALQRKGQYGLYAETGQGADLTNGHGEGFDMLIHESRKYGFVRALKKQMEENQLGNKKPWTHVNDVAGFIGPEVFKTKEQLVRCCLEDTVMGKLHDLTIGLDICSTLHMDVSLDDLDWCIEQIMPVNPAYLMALPTKNDPMLSYLTTSFSDHVKIREQFGYKVNDAMWDFFKHIEIIDAENKPTSHFGDPKWVYLKYCEAKGDTRDKNEIYAEAEKRILEIKQRGVSIAEGYGENIWDLDPQLKAEVEALYEDAKVSLWTPMPQEFIKTIPAAIPILTRSSDRKDYVYHPESGENLSNDAIKSLKSFRESWNSNIPDVQIIISDGLNAKALMDDGHLEPYLKMLKASLKTKGYSVSDQHVVITHGRVRAGYQCGELLFGQNPSLGNKGIIHIIGERPGSGHHNFSTYLTAAPYSAWSKKRWVDHDISRVVSGISDTAFKPEQAAALTLAIFNELFNKEFNELAQMKSA